MKHKSIEINKLCDLLNNPGLSAYELEEQRESLLQELEECEMTLPDGHTDNIYETCKKLRNEINRRPFDRWRAAGLPYGDPNGILLPYAEFDADNFVDKSLPKPSEHPDDQIDLTDMEWSVLAAHLPVI